MQAKSVKRKLNWWKANQIGETLTKSALNQRQVSQIGKTRAKTMKRELS